MLSLKKRFNNDIIAYNFIYPSQGKAYVAKFGGVVDRINHDVYIQTTAGIQKLSINNWIIEIDGLVVIMTETDMFKMYIPVDDEADDAFRMLGGRRWPSDDSVAMMGLDSKAQ